jgi:hypothetical protein
VARIARWLGVDVATVDLDTDPELAAEYRRRVPVVLDRRGRVVAEGRISWWQALRAVGRSFV